MNMHIDEPRSNNTAAGGEGFVGLTSKLSGSGDCCDTSISQQDVHIVIHATGRVNDASALYEYDFIMPPQAS